MAKKVRIGILGAGRIGKLHVTNLVNSIPGAEVVIIADPFMNEETAEWAKGLGITNTTKDPEDVFADDNVDAVFICSSTDTHAEFMIKAAEKGKHIFCEKPLTMNSRDGEQILALVNQNPNIVHGVNFQYRTYPMAQQMRSEVESGAVGRVLSAHGSYLQDHLLFETDYNWKVHEEFTGPSRCVADIGSHWIDLVQQITNAKIMRVCADLATFCPVRKKVTPQSPQGEDVPVKTEDYGAVLFQMDNGAHGVFCVSNSSAGRKNRFTVEIDGAIKSLSWNQEEPNNLFVGHRDRYNQTLTRDPALLCDEATACTMLPPGHPEGWADALYANIRQYYQFVADGKRIGDEPHAFATFEDGLNIIRLVEAILKSHATRQWVEL